MILLLIQGKRGLLMYRRRGFVRGDPTLPSPFSLLASPIIDYRFVPLPYYPTATSHPGSSTLLTIGLMNRDCVEPFHTHKHTFLGTYSLRLLCS